MIRRFFQQDKMWLGILLGLGIPAIVYGILFSVMSLFTAQSGNPSLIKDSTLQLVSIFTNLVTMRYYLLKLKFDYSGRGILLSTMILAIVYFAYYL
jgi:uncharacterized membrane protein